MYPFSNITVNRQFSFAKLAITLLAVFGLAACGDAGHGHHDDGHHPIDTSPKLRSFNIVDSYGTNSEFEPNAELAVSPYLDGGFFEVFWDVKSYGLNYRKRLLINDEASPFGGTLISSTLCGPNRSCGTASYQYCSYTEDFLLGCEVPEGSDWEGDTDISEFVFEIPEELYLVLEVCDRDDLFCEYSSQRVFFE